MAAAFTVTPVPVKRFWIDVGGVESAPQIGEGRLIKPPGAGKVLTPAVQRGAA